MTVPESGAASAAGGHPLRVVALDVGGTVLKGGVFELTDGAPGVRRVTTLRRPTGRSGGPAAVVAATLDTLAELCGLAPDARAVGLVVPGVVDEAAGVAVESENLFWRDVPFARLARERTGLPVAFGHDVRAGGRAELAALPAAPGSRSPLSGSPPLSGSSPLPPAPGDPGPGAAPSDALVMLVGTGIAALLVVGGVVVPGMFAGEIGHAPVGPEEPCACGSTGCLETIASAASIARRYAEAGGPAVPGAREVLAAAGAGDRLASRVWDEAVAALARALAMYTTLLAPEVVVVGGGLSLAGAALLDPLTAGLAARLTFQPMPRVLLGALGDDAGSIGAAMLARDLLAG